MPDDDRYIHGYDSPESERLDAQAASVLDLLHHDTRFPAGCRVLEVGCGTGAQTLSLARNSPGARFVSFDRSATSLAHARARLAAAGVRNVELREEDLHALPFASGSFDHAFVCFVLEHLADPVRALRIVRDLLRPGGTVTVFEGDHGSPLLHPESAAARRAIDCQVQLQRRAGGNACIGRQLYPLLLEGGFADPRVSPRMVYVDGSRPALIESFTRHTFTGMLASMRQAALDAGIIDAAEFDAGIRDLHRVAEPDGVMCYTFFKAVGTA